MSGFGGGVCGLLTHCVVRTGAAFAGLFAWSQPKGTLSKLHNLCDSMRRDDAAKRKPLPEVLAVLMTLLVTRSASPYGDSPRQHGDSPR